MSGYSTVSKSSKTSHRNLIDLGEVQVFNEILPLSSDYAVQIFDEALTSGFFKCYLNPDTLLPMIYIDDCLRGVVEMLEVPQEKLKLRTYNIAAMSFTPEELAAEIRKFIPHFKIAYESDARQDIGKKTGNIYLRDLSVWIFWCVCFTQDRGSGSCDIAECENKWKLFWDQIHVVAEPLDNACCPTVGW